MYAIEFQTQIHDGMIEIPVEQREGLLSQINGGVVRVIVMAPEKKPVVATQTTAQPEIDLVQDAKDKGYTSFLDYLLDHPIRIPNVEYLTREEAHER
ncbi:MAG TPA: hypothetical protein PLD25_29485 [Chloroflexota bacterium]|nr:hypothetical protein [Chloroflexota bacterium]HUM67302.1 hypothetical protein [Chloroflexota bacterium]